ncbi:DUF4974 domain-containing protein [Pedobacter sp. BS3]|uniref:FecR family protein n=1 Tax=Pedobacter sp. BS3 TaxID=2567937 RepID=UPI0011ED0CC0|nr:FecR domain-containing protein [Pedobacter sp. BS3]TZF82239.1 DUF4974 domain-containing protein [Pedobacter sp. BS3]
MNKERTNYLLQQFADNQLTDAEAQELLLLFHEDNNSLFSEKIDTILNTRDKAPVAQSAHWQNMLTTITAIDKPKQIRPVIRYSIFRWVAAAAILILISVGTWLYFNQQHPVIANKNTIMHDILPGGNKATLTLANGEKIILNDRQNGTLASQGSTTITKVQDGKLQVASYTKQRATVQNSHILMVQTPVGGTYQVTLPDGTRVWLNAASSIRFPSVFAASERRVEITGEAYFEVAKKIEGSKAEGKRIPFIVTTNNQQVEVLGTHFNINAYTDEKAIKTTLLEGSVKVSQPNASSPLERAGVRLQPGQQSIITGNTIKVENADTEAAIAWKNNLFRFKDAELKTIMRQLSRWYDIEVAYSDINADGHLTGYISRDVPLSRVLKMLQETSDLNFSVTGRQVTVTHN